jgi:hypothetical protein
MATAGHDGGEAGRLPVRADCWTLSANCTARDARRAEGNGLTRAEPAA